jgi:hypothetical protein
VGGSEVKRVTAWMRAVFIGSALLVGLAGFQLFALPGDTDTSFAWTIQPPLTAAALGGLYLSVVLLTALSARQSEWASARIFVPGTFLFATLILLATLIHVDRFHWHGPTTYAQFQAYLWMTIYVLYPPLLLAAWVHQRGRPGGDRPRRAPLPAWFRSVLGAQAAVFLAVGVALLVDPSWVSEELWPWQLTPLTGRAIAAWLVALGVVAAHAVRENDWERIPVAPVTYAAVGALQLVVVARYGDQLDWGRAEAWAYTAFFALVAAVGVVAIVLASRVRRAHGVPAAETPRL